MIESHPVSSRITWVSVATTAMSPHPICYNYQRRHTWVSMVTGLQWFWQT